MGLLAISGAVVLCHTNRVVSSPSRSDLDVSASRAGIESQRTWVLGTADLDEPLASDIGSRATSDP